MKNMDKKKKIILFSSISILIVLFIISSTVAFFGWSTSEDEEADINVSVIGGEGQCFVKSDNNVTLEPTSTKESGRIIKFTAKQELSETAPISWNMIVNSIGGLQDPSFKYELINTTTGESYGTNNFANITNEVGSNTIAFSNGTETLTYGTEYEFTLYLWIDGNSGNNPISMADQTFNFDMNCVIDGTAGSDSSSSGTNLISHITNLYSNAQKEEYESADGLTYNLASSVHLMNDRLGSATTEINDGNIRFYGGDAEVNNYVDIGDRTIDGEVIPYRIIGLFKDVKLVKDDNTTESQDLIKIIRADSIGTYAWDNKKNGIGSATNTNGYGSNNWSDARLMMLLNPGYDTNVFDTNNNLLNQHNRSYYWYSTGTSSSQVKCYSGTSNAAKNCYFESIGLSADARNKVAKATWTMANLNSSNVYGNSAYQTENTGTEWQGNVALMYVSDIYYSRNLKGCTGTLSSTCADTDNWLYLSSYEWSLTTYTFSIYNYMAWRLVNGSASGNYTVYTATAVRPVLYLDPELVIDLEHEGTRGDPFIISKTNP